ncbi:MAG: DUF5320 domain-containing protein [Methanomicrobiales archaeon]
MPGMDGTGPMGEGPMTGRRMGWCNPAYRYGTAAPPAYQPPAAPPQAAPPAYAPPYAAPGGAVYGVGRGGLPRGGGRGFCGGRGRRGRFW